MKRHANRFGKTCLMFLTRPVWNEMAKISMIMPQMYIVTVPKF